MRKNQLLELLPVIIIPKVAKYTSNMLEEASAESEKMIDSILKYKRSIRNSLYFVEIVHVVDMQT
jgi:hypothetical protein